jgi:hypothetical protein
VVALAEVVEIGDQPVGNLLGDLAVDPARHPPAAPLLDDRQDLVLMHEDIGAHRPQQVIEDLVMRAVPAQDREQGRQRRRQLDLAQLSAQGDLHQPLQHLVVERAQEEGREQRQPIDDRVGIAPVGQPGAEPPADAERAQACGNQLRLQEVPLDEAAEPGADPVPAVRDHGRVRDRQPQGPAEQGGDREPVRQAADQRCFRAGAQKIHPEAGEPRLHCGEIGDAHRDQQRGGDGAVPAQAAALLQGGGCFGGVGHGHSPSGARRMSEHCAE